MNTTIRFSNDAFDRCDLETGQDVIQFIDEWAETRESTIQEYVQEEFGMNAQWDIVDDGTLETVVEVNH